MSIEAFIIRIFRRGTRAGFIKAFTDNPKSLTTGFNKLSLIMQQLCVRRLHLWPRFHGAVEAALTAKQPEVVEIMVPLSPAMAEVQKVRGKRGNQRPPKIMIFPRLSCSQAILRVMACCLEDLKRCLGAGQ